MAHKNLDARRTRSFNLLKVMDASTHHAWTWKASKLQNNTKCIVNIRAPINWNHPDPIHNGVLISHLPTYQVVDYGQPGAALLFELQPVLVKWNVYQILHKELLDHELPAFYQAFVQNGPGWNHVRSHTWGGKDGELSNLIHPNQDNNNLGNGANN